MSSLLNLEISADFQSHTTWCHVWRCITRSSLLHTVHTNSNKPICARNRNCLKNVQNSSFFPDFLPKTLWNPFFPEKRTLNLNEQPQTQKTIELLFLVFKTMKQYPNELKISSKCSQNDHKAKTRKKLQEFSSFFHLKSRRNLENLLTPSSENYFTWKTKVKLPHEA